MITTVHGRRVSEVRSSGTREATQPAGRYATNSEQHIQHIARMEKEASLITVIEHGNPIRGSQPRIPKTRVNGGEIAVGGLGARGGTKGGTNANGANSIPMAMRARALPLVIAGTRVRMIPVAGETKGLPA